MKAACVTLATNKKYLKGAALLYMSYLKYGNYHPFYVMVYADQDVSGYEFLPLLVVPKVKPKNKDHYTYQKNFPLSPDIFSKINVWLFEEFDYILFVDADYVFLEKCDFFIRDCIDTLKATKTDMIVPSLYDFSINKEIHKCFDASSFFIKPNRNTFFELLNNIDTCETEEILFYNLYKNNKINIWYPGLDIDTNELMSYKKDKYLLHMGGTRNDNIWKKELGVQKDKKVKYWECKEGLLLFKQLMEKK